MLETVKKCSYLVSQLSPSAVVTDYGQLITSVYIHRPGLRRFFFFAISVCVCETNSPSVCNSLSLISHAVLSLRRQRPHPAVPPLSLADWSTSHGCVRCICVFKCLICETLCVSAHWPLLWPARGHIPSLRLKVCFDKL